MTGTLLKRLEQHIWWSSQKHVLPPRGALRNRDNTYSPIFEHNEQKCFKQSEEIKLYLFAGYIFDLQKQTEFRDRRIHGNTLTPVHFLRFLNGHFCTKDALSVWKNLGKHSVVRLGYASLV